jgi:hypothetical protein
MKISALTDAQFAALLSNFSGKIDNYSKLLDLSATEVADLITDNSSFAYVIDVQNRVKQHSKDWTSYKNLLRSSTKKVNLGATPVWVPPPAVPTPATADISGRTAKLIQRIKNHAAYTEAIGHDLGIVAITANATPADFAAMKPALKIHLVAGQPILQWVKGDADGIEIHKAEGNSGGYKFLDMDMHPHFADKAPLPANGQSVVWKYKAIYRLGDERIGLWSDEVSVSVMG